VAGHFWRLIDLPLVEIVLAGVLAAAIVCFVRPKGGL
jgi:hypothetical protein